MAELRNKGNSYKPPNRRPASARPASAFRIPQLSSTQEQLDQRRLKFASRDSSSTTHTNPQYGLLSRGEDNRLQRDPNARRDFFKQIQSDFLLLFADGVDLPTLNLSRQFELPTTIQDKKFDHTLMQLRKLREALLKFPVDDFSKSVYLFSIRVSTRVGHYQTYIPSIVNLLKHKSKLSKIELDEIINLYVLHLIHFNGDDELAVKTYFNYARKDLRLREVCESWRSLNYYKWFELYSTERDSSRKRIMSFGEERMALHAIRCISKAYHQLSKAYVENIFRKNLTELKEDYSCNWACEGNTVVIKPRK